MSLTLWLIILAVATVPLILSSMFICVPKWWRAEASGRLPVFELPEACYNERFWKVIRIGVLILAAPLLIPLAIIGWLVVGLFQSAAAVIEMACPYTPQSYMGRTQRRDLRSWASAPGGLVSSILELLRS